MLWQNERAVGVFFGFDFRAVAKAGDSLDPRLSGSAGPFPVPVPGRPGGRRVKAASGQKARPPGYY